MPPYIGALVNPAVPRLRPDRTAFRARGTASGARNNLGKTPDRRSNESGGSRGQESSRLHQGHGGYQVDPVASSNWVLVPDGSIRSVRRQEVAIYTFLVPRSLRRKFAYYVKQEGYNVLDVLPDE